MSSAVEINGIHKKYGAKTVLNNLSLSVKEGSCFGLLGPNGAGKSTTMKILSGLFGPDRGTVSVFGQDVHRSGDKIRQQIGYIPQAITLYEKLSSIDNLRFFGELYGVRGAELNKRIAEVLEQVGLADRAKEPVLTFSGGMKRRINIAAALLHKPRIIIMDEPTVGIDPQSRNHIFEMIRAFRKEGATILYSTHYMEEVETLCDDLAIIDHGNVIAIGSLDVVLDKHGTHAVYLENEESETDPVFPGVDAPIAHGKGWLFQTNHPLLTLKEIANICSQQGLAVKKLEIVHPSLESVFLSLTGTSLRDR